MSDVRSRTRDAERPRPETDAPAAQCAAGAHRMSRPASAGRERSHAVHNNRMQCVHQVLAARRGPVLRGVESTSGRCAACEVTHGSMPCFCTSSRNDTRVRQ